MQWILRLQNWLRLEATKKMFHTLREKTGSLSATEAFSADVIHLLGRPTLGQFAATLGISQPNATYKVNNLAAKGYLEDPRRTGARYASRLPENSTPITTTMSRRCASHGCARGPLLPGGAGRGGARHAGSGADR